MAAQERITRHEFEATGRDKVTAIAVTPAMVAKRPRVALSATHRRDGQRVYTTGGGAR